MASGEVNAARWRPPSLPRPSLSMFWLRRHLVVARASWTGARRRTILSLPNPAMYPEHSPPAMKLERIDNCISRIVMRSVFARRIRRPA